MSRSRNVRPWVAMIALLAAACGPNTKVAYKDLLDSDPQVRADAANRLGQSKSKEAVESLIAVANDPDEVVRVHVVRALAEIGDRRAIPTLLGLATDPLRTVRMSVCQALTAIPDPAAVDALSKLLYDPEENIRLNAARALANIPGDASLELLLQTALQDDSEKVREIVVVAVGERRSKDAVPKLEQMLQGESDRVRANAAEVLGQLGDASSVPVLVRALDDPAYKVRSLAAHSLVQVAPQDPAVREALARRLATETHGITTIDLAWTLAVAGDRSGVGRIRDLLLRGDPEDVRAEAAIALGEVGEKSDVPLLERAVKDRKGLVRNEAFKAIEKLRKS